MERTLRRRACGDELRPAVGEPRGSVSMRGGPGRGAARGVGGARWERGGDARSRDRRAEDRRRHRHDASVCRMRECVSRVAPVSPMERGMGRVSRRGRSDEDRRGAKKKPRAEWIQATRGRRTSAVIRADRARPMGPTGRSRCSGDSPVEVRCARRGLAALGFSLGYLCSVGTQADEANHPLRFWPALRSTVEEPRKKATTAPHLATLRHVSRPCRPYPTRRCPIRTNLRLIPAWTWRSSSSLTSSTSRRASTSLGLASCGWKPSQARRVRMEAGSTSTVPDSMVDHALTRV